MTVPYSFANATVSIPLSQLDANFNTPITLGNTAIQLGNTVTTLNNMTLANVTISSGNVTITNVSVTTANVTTANITNMVSGNVAITGGSINGTTLGATTASTANVTTLTTSSTVTINGGTANGVAYLNGSKVLTTGSALTFDGTTLTGTSATSAANLVLNNTASGTQTYATLNSGATVLGALLRPNATNDIQLNANFGSLVWGIGSAGTATEQMRLTSTGLGIGTSSPGTYSSRLVAVSQAGGAAQSLDAPSGTNTALNWYYNGTAKWTTQVLTTGEFRFFDFTASATRLTIDTSGNLGLGVTPSAWGAGSQAFQNGGGAVFQYNNDRIFIGQNSYIDSSFADRFIGNGYATRYRQYQGTHAFYVSTVSNSSGAGASQTLTQAMTLDASSQLLVGTTSNPYGNRFTVGGSATYRGIEISTTTASARPTLTFLNINTNTYGSFIQDSSAGDLIFGRVNADYGGHTERARITSGGDLLVGTTTFGQPDANAVALGGSDGSVRAHHLTGTASGSIYSYFTYGGLGIGSISQNGTTAVAYNTSSDYRLKDNPQPLTGSGAFIDALKPKTWNWKSDGSKGVGFIAHEVQEVSPASVTGEKDGEQMQAMEYGSAEFIANIIAELQSLRARVAQLEAK